MCEGFFLLRIGLVYRVIVGGGFWGVDEVDLENVDDSKFLLKN